jgi:KDO2-lipid IV(A) lauroyltransferase
MRARGLIDYTAYLAVMAFFLFAGLLPRGASARFGRLLASVVFSLGTSMRRRVLDNLKTAFGGEKTEEELVEIARAFYTNMGLFIMEFAKQPRIDKDYVDRYVPFEGLDNLDRALESGRGVVLFTAHLGNWELLSAALAIKGYRINTVVRPLDNTYLEAALKDLRSRFGTRVIAKRDSLRKMIETLRGGGIVGVLLDQRASARDGVPADFFGTRALTNKGPATVIMRTGAAALPIFIVREDTFRHRVICCEPVELVDTGSRELDIIENTQRFTSAIEGFVRAHPDQWFWFHSRWARRKKKSKGGRTERKVF